MPNMRGDTGISQRIKQIPPLIKHVTWENSNKQVSKHVICQPSIMPMEKQQYKVQ